MIETLIEHISPLHWLMAYAGALLHLLMKYGEHRKQPGFTFGGWIKENLLHTIINFISIPVVMVLISDPAVQTYLPLTYPTALLAGWQTQSMLKSLIAIGKGIIAPKN